MGKKKVRDFYFAEKEEQAVLNYGKTSSSNERNDIFNVVLREPFRKMVQSILRKYPIHIGNFSMDEVEKFALSHLVEQMVKYRPFIVQQYKNENNKGSKWSKIGDEYNFIYRDDAEQMLIWLRENTAGEYRIFNSKAFSYCQTIVRNFFKDWGKKTFTEKKINLSFDDYVDEINQNVEYQYENEDEHESLDKLIKTIVDKIKERISGDTVIKKNEINVGEAIINVLENWDVLFLEDTHEGKYDKKITNKFAKNKILFFLKEQTGLTTKEIRLAIKPFKEIYFIEKDILYSE